MNARSSAEPAVYLVAIDGSDTVDHVIEVASGLGAALAVPAELHVFHVIEALAPATPTGWVASPTDSLEVGRKLLDRVTAAAAGRFAGRIVGHLGAGEPWREITQIASDLHADLVVVGTAGRKGLARLALGSVAEQVVRHAGCPVLVVRPKEQHALVALGIEPPCPDCVATQKATGREKLWCERHSTRRPHGRVHYELPESFALGSMNFRP